MCKFSFIDVLSCDIEECALPAEQKHYQPNQPNQQQQQQQQQQQYEPDYSELACFSDGDEWLVPLESLPALANMTAPLTTPASSYQQHQHHQQQQQLPPADEDGMHGQLLLPDDLQDLVLDTDDLARLPLHSANTILDDLMSSGDTNSSHSSVSNSLQLTPSPQSHTLSVVDDIGCLSDSGVDIGDSGCTSLPPLHPSPHEQQQQQSGFGKRRVSVCHKRRRTAAAAGAAVAVHKRSTPYSRSHTPPAAAAAPKPAAAAFSGSSSPSSVAAAAAAKSALTEEQRRERKRQQNKLAATRYRQKKRQEMTVVAVDEDQLEQRNRQLKERVLSLTKELDYLRQLMRQVLLHKQVV